MSSSTQWSLDSSYPPTGSRGLPEITKGFVSHPARSDRELHNGRGGDDHLLAFSKPRVKRGHERGSGVREGHGHWLGVFQAALALAEEEPRPAPGTRGPVTHIFLNGRRSPDPRRLLIRYLLMKCSEHRFKLHVAQQPRETVGLKKKNRRRRDPSVCGGWAASRPGRAGAGSCLRRLPELDGGREYFLSSVKLLCVC